MTTGAEEAAVDGATLTGRVFEAVQSRFDRIVALVTELVAVESPSLEPAAQLPAFDLLGRALQDAGMTCRRRRGRVTGGMLLAVPGDRAAGPVQLLMGHCDTVWPVGTLERMPVVTEGSHMRGPGIFDMKAGLVQAIHALGVLRELGLEPVVQPVMLINSDEEIGSRESAKYIRWLARLADRTFVLEPALTPTGKIKTERKGVAQYRIRVRGVAAHAGLNPEQGVSAILELSLIIQQLFALNNPTTGVSVNVGTIDGGMRPNVIAPESQATIDVRVPTMVDAQRVDEAIRGLRPSRPGIELEISGTESRPPMETSPGSRKLWGAATRIAQQMGVTLEEGRAGGGSDGNITCQYCPTLDGLGAVGDGAHAVHEYIDLERIAERTALLAMLIMQPPVSQLAEGPP